MSEELLDCSCRKGEGEKRKLLDREYVTTNHETKKNYSLRFSKSIILELNFCFTNSIVLCFQCKFFN